MPWKKIWSAGENKKAYASTNKDIGTPVNSIKIVHKIKGKRLLLLITQKVI